MGRTRPCWLNRNTWWLVRPLIWCVKGLRWVVGLARRK